MSGLGPNAKIASDIENLRKCNGRLDRLLVKIGTQADNDDLHSRLEKDRDVAKHLCKTVLDALAALRGDPMANKLSNDFAREMQRFERIAQDIAKRERAVGRAAAAGGHYAPDNEALLGRGGAGSGDVEEGGYGSGLALTHADEETLDLEQQRRRQAEILAVQRDVEDIHAMFVDLQTITQKNGEVLDNIEASVTTAHEQVVAAHEDIKGAEDYQNKARRKKCCFMMILVIIVVAIVIGVWQGLA